MALIPLIGSQSELADRLGRRLAGLPSRGKLALMLAADAVFLPLCMLAAVALRLGSLENALDTVPLVQVALGLCCLPVLAVAGLYQTVVRYIEVRVVIRSGIALAAAVLVTYVIAVGFSVSVMPRSALLSYWFVAFAYVLTSRFLARTLLRRGLRREDRPRLRTAIYGGGDAGAQIAQSMQFSLEYKAVCFFDDRQSLHRKSVAGLPVYGPAQLADLVDRLDIDQIVVAIPSASASQKRAVIQRLETAKVPIKVLPSLVELVDGRASLADIRSVDVGDLLGRDPVPPQEALFARNIRDRIVMVTGAGGSIGSELCRQIMTSRPARLVLFDHSEYLLYAIDRELRAAAGGVDIVPVLGSVQDEARLLDAMRTHGVETVYHAAAYKHVPLVEANVRQGVLNNVFGSLAVARAAATAGVATCVLVSTDKAVRPTNVMGATKRVAELVFQAAAARSRSTVYSMVRFGNVLGSSGSVVPLFSEQIRNGGPITITHPEIMRYFMLIPEAAQLVIQAGAMARGGEVFVLDMGDPVKIVDLARSMIRLAGLTERTPEAPEGNIGIEFIGLRPGEKLYEELLIGDNVVPSGHPRILCAQEHLIEPSLLDRLLDQLRQACAGNQTDAVLRLLRSLVPEFQPGFAGTPPARQLAAGSVGLASKPEPASLDG